MNIKNKFVQENIYLVQIYLEYCLKSMLDNTQ